MLCIFHAVDDEIGLDDVLGRDHSQYSSKQLYLPGAPVRPGYGAFAVDPTRRHPAQVLRLRQAAVAGGYADQPQAGADPKLKRSAANQD